MRSSFSPICRFTFLVASFIFHGFVGDSGVYLGAVNCLSFLTSRIFFTAMS